MTELRRVAVTLEQCWHRVPGGTATAAVDSVRALQASTDLELVGVAARHGEPPPAAFTPPVPVRHLPLPRPALYEAWHRLRWPPVERATGTVDVIHATGMAVPPRTAPLVVTLHDLAFVHEPGHATRRGLAFFHRAVELAAREADLLVCPSQATIDDAVAYGMPPERLRLVPWGIATAPATAEEVTAVRARHRLRRPYLLWVGTIEPRKNLPGLLEAMAHLVDDGEADLELVLVGPEGWNEDLAPWMTRLGGRVRLLGFVPSADLAPLYAGAEVFCFPSFREGFGLPVLEAMAQGTPVVTSSDTALAELVGTEGASAGGLVVDPRDPHALAAALASVVGDDALSARLGAAARQRAGSYTWERTATALVDAYREAMGEQPGPRVDGDGDRSGRPVVRSGPRRGPARARRRRDGRARVGCNLLWLVPGDVGGSEEYTVRLLRAVADHPDTDVVPVLFVNQSFGSAYADLTNHFETVLAPVDGASRPRRVLAESSWLAAAVRRHAIDVSHHLGGTVPVVRPTPSLVTIHDLQPLAMPEHFGPVKRRYLTAVAPWSCRVADRVVTLTRFTQLDVVARTGIEPARTTVVPPGLDQVEPVPDAELAAVRRRYGLGDHPFFLFPAIPYPHKNHSMLLRAFAGVRARVPTALLVLTGGTGPLDAELEAEAHRLGLTAAVRRLGRIPWGDVDALYRSATALTFPSSYEGFGMPTLEAMTRGCPVLAADAGALPEVVGDGGQLLDPADPKAWEEAMVAVASEPGRRRDLITAGRARSAAYDWGRSADALLGAWRSVVTTSEGAP